MFKHIIQFFGGFFCLLCVFFGKTYFHFLCPFLIGLFGGFFAIEGYDAVYFLFLSLTLFFFNVYFYLFIWLHQVFVVARRIFNLRCDMWDFFSFLLFFFLVMTCELSYRLWDLVPWPGMAGMELGPPELGAQSPSHWTTMRSPQWVSSDSLFFKDLCD